MTKKHSIIYKNVSDLKQALKKQLENHKNFKDFQDWLTKKRETAFFYIPGLSEKRTNEMIEEFLKEMLNNKQILSSMLKKEYYLKMQKDKRLNCFIENIRIFEENNEIFALADVEYLWTINEWNKTVHHKNMIFIHKENEWHSPIFPK